MDKNEAIKIAKRYIRNVSSHYQINSVVLFGSFAKGTQHSDSDIDLAIVFESVDDIIDMQIELLKLRTDDDLLIEPHPFQMADFTSSNPVVSEILKNGIKLADFAA
jgi:predicted nucleotidyltransferase